MNKCICLKSPMKETPVEKGDTFTYSLSIKTTIPKSGRCKEDGISRWAPGDTKRNSFLNYDGNEGFGPPVKVELYDVNTGRHRFSITKTTFDEYFVDIVEFREEQIEKILD